MEEKIYRIGIDARLFGTAQAAGIGQYTEELVRNLLNNDSTNQYYLFLSPKSWAGFPIHASNLTIIKVGIPHYSLAEQLRYPTILRSADLDLIHYTNFNSPIWWKGVPSVVSIMDLTLWWFAGRSQKSWWRRWAYRIAIKKACQNAQRIIAISEATKQDIIRVLHIPADKITVTYLAVADRYKPIHDPERIENIKHKFNISKPYLLYVGQWRQHKNVVRLIRAFHLLRRRYNLDYQLVLAGKIDTQCPEVMETIKQLGLKSEVVLTGYVPDMDLPLLYNAAEAFVFPSLYEGFGLPPLEAMACGTPVVASKASCLPEILGAAAEYFDPLNIEDMVKAMVGVAKNYSLQQTLRAAGFKQVKKYSFNQTAQQTLEVYRQILK